MDESYYDILQVSKRASESVIRAAYKSLVQQYHPDKFTTEKEIHSANKRMAEINAAYDCLSNTARRSEYDSKEEEYSANERPQKSTGEKNHSPEESKHTPEEVKPKPKEKSPERNGVKESPITWRDGGFGVRARNALEMHQKSIVFLASSLIIIAAVWLIFSKNWESPLSLDYWFRSNPGGPMTQLAKPYFWIIFLSICSFLPFYSTCKLKNSKEVIVVDSVKIRCISSLGGGLMFFTTIKWSDVVAISSGFTEKDGTIKRGVHIRSSKDAGPIVRKLVAPTFEDTFCSAEWIDGDFEVVIAALMRYRENLR